MKNTNTNIALSRRPVAVAIVVAVDGVLSSRMQASHHHLIKAFKDLVDCHNRKKMGDGRRRRMARRVVVVVTMVRGGGGRALMRGLSWRAVQELLLT
jgi:hypothetical protein